MVIYLVEDGGMRENQIPCLSCFFYEVTVCYFILLLLLYILATGSKIGCKVFYKM